MNIHYITKSLFVGAAVVCIGISSVKADLGSDLEKDLWDVISKRMEFCYKQVRKVVPGLEAKGKSLDDSYIRTDTRIITERLLGNLLRKDGFYQSVVNNPWIFELSKTLKNPVKSFLEEHCPTQKSYFWDFYLGKNFECEPLCLFRTLSDFIGWQLYVDVPVNLEGLAKEKIIEKCGSSYRLNWSFVFSDDFCADIAKVFTKYISAPQPEDHKEIQLFEPAVDENGEPDLEENMRRLVQAIQAFSNE